MILKFVEGPLCDNNFLVYNETTKNALLIDCTNPSPAIDEAIDSNNLNLTAILLTHGHFDHIMSIDTLRQAEPGLKVYIHTDDAPMPGDGKKNAFGLFFGQDRTWQDADVLMEDGQTISVGNATFRVIHTPGHSPGSVCFLCEEEGVMITGDTLFADNIGRCDLWEGSHAVMRKTLQGLRSYDGSLTIYPGHGGTNTLGKALDNVFFYA